MNFRRKLLPVLVAVAILLFGQTQAVVCASADSTKLGSLSVIMKTEQGGSLEGAGLSIIRVASMNTKDGKYTYSLLSGFDSAGIVLNNTMTSEENKAAAALLKQYATSGQMTSECVWTNSEGKAVKSGLSSGIYLVVQSVSVTGYYDITPFLVFLPFLDSDGTTWLYDLTISPKGENNTHNGSEPTVTPTPGTNSGILDVSREIPPATVGGSSDKDGASAVKLPQTGMLLWPIVVLSGAGILIFCLGWIDIHSKRKKR